MESTSLAPPLPTSSARHLLRQGLASLHESLDRRVSAACLEPAPDLPRLLRLHAAALPALVGGLAGAGAARLWPGWDEPERLAALAGDLRRHGLGGFRPAAPALFAGEAAAWGGIYALLGSRLGNRVVLRRFAEAGRPAESAFLRHGEDRAGGTWPRFLARMEVALAGGAVEEARHGAARVMRAYLDALAVLPDPIPVTGQHRHDAIRA